MQEEEEEEEEEEENVAWKAAAARAEKPGDLTTDTGPWSCAIVQSCSRRWSQCGSHVSQSISQSVNQSVSQSRFARFTRFTGHLPAACVGVCGGRSDGMVHSPRG